MSAKKKSPKAAKSGQSQRPPRSLKSLQPPKSNTVTVTDANFDSIVLDSEIPVLVDFWASWCAPCRALAPTLESLAEELEGELLVVKYNTEKNNRVAQAMAIRSLPTMVLFKDGEVAGVQMGAMPVGRLLSWIQKQLAPKRSFWERFRSKSDDHAEKTPQ